MVRKSKIPKTKAVQFESCRTRVSVRISVSDFKKLEEVWITLKYPDPYNPEKRIPFKSREEFLRFLVRSSLEASPTAWYIYSQILNPDFPQK